MTAKSWLKGLIYNTIWVLHPRLPWAVARHLLARRNRRTLASEERLAYGREQMRHLLPDADDATIEAAARRHLEFWNHQAVIRWNTRRAIKQTVTGIENLRAAEALGRGVLVTFVHHGHYLAVFGAFKAAGIDQVTIARAKPFGWVQKPGERQNFFVVRRGGPLVDMNLGTKGIIERLARGQNVMIAADVPGSSTVQFAGRPVKCSSGGLWAARANNTPVVPFNWVLTDDGPVIRFGEMMLPEDHPDMQEFLEKVMAGHERHILAWPEATMTPTLTWRRAEA